MLLREFSGPEGLFAYDKQEQRVFMTSPKQILVETDLYRLENTVDFEFSLESHLLADVDSAGAHARTIIERDLDPEERGAFSRFLAFAALRTPRMLQQLSEAAGQVAKHFQQHDFKMTPDEWLKSRLPPGTDIDEARAFVAKGDYDLIPSKNLPLSTMVELSGVLAARLAGMGWGVARSESESFILTDSPVSLMLPMAQQNTFNMSLNPQHCLVIADHHGAQVPSQEVLRGDVPCNEARTLNIAAAQVAERWLVGPDGAQLEELAEQARTTPPQELG